MLNEQQKKVIENNNRFLFLLAGAGSGKTRTIVEKIKYIINNKIALSSEILAITFTKKAALEMAERIGDKEVFVATFHSFCYKVIKDFDNREIKIANDQLPFKKSTLLSISKYKNGFIKLNKPLLFDEYQKYLLNNDLIDFDDLLVIFLNIIETFEDVRIKYQAMFKFIFIDEFQDTNELQYKILKHLISNNNNVLAVGDPDQSIYSFRGANPFIINRFIKDYKSSILTLNVNYRSTTSIIENANKVILLNKDRVKKILIGNTKESGIVERIIFDDKTQEALFIVNKIKSHIANKIPHSEIAILFRNHFFAKKVISFLDSTYIPYQYDEDNRKNKIQCLTIHQAKGLEFEVVFIIGLEWDNFPMYVDNMKLELQEERRLFFVGITRAKRFLYLSCARQIDNRLTTPSQFFLKQ